MSDDHTGLSSGCTCGVTSGGWRRGGGGYLQAIGQNLPAGGGAAGTPRYAPGVATLHRFLVLWGQMGKPLFTTEVVEAFDPDDALARAAELHPDLHRPRVAVPAAAPGPATGRYARDDGRPTTEG